MNLAIPNLPDRLRFQANASPNSDAAVQPGLGKCSYLELDRLSEQLAAQLIAKGVCKGDRVGIWIKKSIDSLISIFAIMKCGAAYVPVDIASPAVRAAKIYQDCDVRLVILEASKAKQLSEQYNNQDLPEFVLLDDPVDKIAIKQLFEGEPQPKLPDMKIDPDDLAYILYTSGSTGQPKGVTLTHRNAIEYVDWAITKINPTEVDVFSSHAPFHFDLSVLDLYCAVSVGAKIVLIGEHLSKEPTGLSNLITEEKITIWYSTPSILSLLVDHGNLSSEVVPDLRVVLFAGEVFPISKLLQLIDMWPHPSYYNLYGPTETNVCTYFRVPDNRDVDKDSPLPIGTTCEHLESIVVDEKNRKVEPGQKGELCITGAAVTKGYWNQEEKNKKAFLITEGKKWYRTGDIVSLNNRRQFVFHGRIDRMIKRRGYRIELGEIENCLYQMNEIKEVCVTAKSRNDGDTLVAAHIVTDTGTPLSTIKIKTFCSTRIPVYMIPDTFHYYECLPKTSTDKVDLNFLTNM